jgi:hypothetical protein
MNLSETARVLAYAQAFDQRTVGETDVIAWHSLFVDAAFGDVQEAVKQHYMVSPDRVMPATVLSLVREMVRAREAADRDTGWAPGQAGVPRAEAMPEVAGPVDESALTAPVRALLDSVRAMLPEGSREALMPRRVAWEREHAMFLRTQSAEPNPLYKPTVAEPDCACEHNNMSGGHADGCPLATW